MIKRLLILLLAILTPLFMGAFPTTGILDNFNRGNEAPVTGWTDIANGIQIVGNVIIGTTDAANNMAGWDATTFGPNSEAYATASGTSANILGVAARLTTLVAGTMDGYLAWQAGANNVQLYRIDDGANTQIGGDTAFVMASGDKLGIECLQLPGNDSIKAWVKDGAAAWAAKVSTTDGAHGSAGYLAAAVFDDDPAARALDDFGGGTIAEGQLIYIQMSAIPLILIITLALSMRKNGNKVI